MSALGVGAFELRIVQIDLGCGHVVERLATESSRGLRGSLLRCPWCDNLQLVVDVVGDPAETPRR